MRVVLLSWIQGWAIDTTRLFLKIANPEHLFTRNTMKSLTFFSLFLLASYSNLFAQASQGINYQVESDYLL
jgi:hypothetical protein